MKQLARRALTRAGQVVFEQLERRQETLRQQLVKRLDRLDERVDRAIAQAEQNAALLSSRGRRVTAATRGRALPRLSSELTEPVPPPPSQGFAHDTTTLDACPCCGGEEFTLVSEFNRFLTSQHAPDACASRYHYSLCHRCGVVFARIRPVGPRFRTLLERFEDTLGRHGKPGTGIDLLGSRRLSPDQAAGLRETAARGVFGSADGPDGHPALPALLRDRLAVSAHVEILTSLLRFSEPRVLELRPRFGAIGAAIRRSAGGETFALPLFEAQQIIVGEVYGTRADVLLDYDQFTIPYEGSFDLVVANHMMTHAVRPAAMLAAIRERLAPGGHLYLYNEPDEGDFLDGGKSMFKTLNPFHVQTFDMASLKRALQTAGFRPIFSTHYQGNCVVLAEVAEPRLDGLGVKARARRLARYGAARDRSILMLPDSLRGHFRHEWEAVIGRAFDSGLVTFDDKGSLRLRKRT